MTFLFNSKTLTNLQECFTVIKDLFHCKKIIITTIIIKAINPAKN
jgi:hypothetical protein